LVAPKFWLFQNLIYGRYTSAILARGLLKKFALKWNRLLTDILAMRWSKKFNGRGRARMLPWIFLSRHLYVYRHSCREKGILRDVLIELLLLWREWTMRHFIVTTNRNVYSKKYFAAPARIICFLYLIENYVSYA